MRSAIKLRFSSWKEMLKGKVMLVVGGVWVLLGAFDLIKTELFPTAYQEYTALRLLEYFSWRTWLIVLLFILIGILLEGGHAALERRDKKWDEKRRGIEFTHAQLIREHSEKAVLLRGEIVEKDSKIKDLEIKVSQLPRPKVYLEWKIPPFVSAGMGSHAFFLKNGGDADAFNLVLFCETQNGFSVIHSEPVNKIGIGDSTVLRCYALRADDKGVNKFLGGIKEVGLETAILAMDKANVTPSLIVKLVYKDFENKSYTDSFNVFLDNTLGLNDHMEIEKM